MKVIESADQVPAIQEWHVMCILFTLIFMTYLFATFLLAVFTAHGLKKWGSNISANNK